MGHIPGVKLYIKLLLMLCSKCSVDSLSASLLREGVASPTLKVPYSVFFSGV